MGASFTSIQLRTSDTDQSDITEKVVEYIVKLNAEAGFKRIADEDQSDKSIIISPSDDLTWISIYDEDAEDQNLRKLNKLASCLSKEFKTIALSILVNDSDLVYVGLTNNGTLKDTISNRLKKINFGKSNPSVWSDLLINSYSFEDVKDAWQSKSIFVEDFLTRFAKLINLDASKLVTGYEYLNEESLTKEIKLNFVQENKKKSPELGLTKFSLVAGSTLVDAKKGKNQFREWILTNEGASSNGLDVIVAGECIENGLIIPDFVNIGMSVQPVDMQNNFTASFIEATSTIGEKIFYARVEDIIIPEGYKPTFPMTSKESKRYNSIRYDRAIKFNVSFIVEKEGVGEFTIFFCPLVNRQEGSYSSKVFKAA